MHFFRSWRSKRGVDDGWTHRRGWRGKSALGAIGARVLSSIGGVGGLGDVRGVRGGRSVRDVGGLGDMRDMRCVGHMGNLAGTVGRHDGLLHKHPPGTRGICAIIALGHTGSRGSNLRHQLSLRTRSVESMTTDRRAEAPGCHSLLHGLRSVTARLCASHLHNLPCVRDPRPLLPCEPDAHGNTRRICPNKSKNAWGPFERQRQYGRTSAQPSCHVACGNSRRPPLLSSADCPQAC